MRLGETFLMPCPLVENKILHLWIVISDPTQHGGTFVIVNLTTNEARAGMDCKLVVDDHPWITEDCFVSFPDALEITPAGEANIAQLVAQGFAKPQEDMGAETLQMIIESAKESKALAPVYKKYL
jgi:hypothetical protein